MKSVVAISALAAFGACAAEATPTSLYSVFEAQCLVPLYEQRLPDVSNMTIYKGHIKDLRMPDSTQRFRAEPRSTSVSYITSDTLALFGCDLRYTGSDAESLALELHGMVESKMNSLGVEKLEACDINENILLLGRYELPPTTERKWPVSVVATFIRAGAVGPEPRLQLVAGEIEKSAVKGKACNA